MEVAVVGGVLALIGVFIGATLAAAFELYRRALDAQSAARLIRVETIDNRSKAEELVAARPIRSGLEAAAWKEFRLAIAPFVEELRLIRLAQSYAEARDFQVLRIPATGHLVLDPRDKGLVEAWLVKMQDQARWLHEIEAENPWRLAASLLRRKRVATPEEIRAEYGVTDDMMREREEQMKRRKEQIKQEQDVTQS